MCIVWGKIIHFLSVNIQLFQDYLLNKLFCLFIIWILCLLITEVINSLFIWDMYTFIRYMLSKYFLLLCDLPLQFLNCIFPRATILNLMKIISAFSHFLWDSFMWFIFYVIHIHMWFTHSFMWFIFCVSCFKTICLTWCY